MITIIIFIVACGLTVFVFKKTRYLKKQARDKEIRYHFLKSSLEFLVPFTFVMFFYIGLLAVVSLAWESISLQSLIRLEEWLATIHSYIKLKPSKTMVLGLFLGIYTLGLLRIILLEKRKKLYTDIDIFYKWTKRLYVVFVLLCSFTFLGTQLGEPSNDLRLRIKLTRDGYADVHKQTQEAISEEVAVQLYAKSYDSFSPAYHTALKLPEQIASEANTLRGYYVKAQNEYGVKSIKAEFALSAIEAHRKAVINLKTEIQMPKDGLHESTNVAKPDPSQISYRKIKEAKVAIENYRQKTRSRFITFLTTEDGKRLTIQGAKVMTDILKSELFSPWIKAYPIAEPIIDVFIKAVDDTGEAKIEKTADNATPSIIQSPDNTQPIVNDEASKLAAQTKIKISPEIMEKANQSGQQLEQALTHLKAAKVDLDSGIKQVENSRIERLIAQLHSPDATIRKTAAQNLSQNGTKLSQTKVNELIDIMRHGNKNWITSRTRNEGHHCTDYEYTSIRYYAATALSDMNSQYVSQDITREARQNQSDSVTTERVTDPGWV
jgi:hypothetical protein